MFIQAIGAIFGGISLLLAGWASIQSRKTEAKTEAKTTDIADKTATREEVQQAFDVQSSLLDRLERNNAALEAKVSVQQELVESSIGRAAIAESEHQKCEEDRRRLLDQVERITTRLSLAEARIGELGG